MCEVLSLHVGSSRDPFSHDLLINRYGDNTVHLHELGEKTAEEAVVGNN